MSTQSRITERDRLLKLIAGIKKHLSDTKSLVLHKGTSYKPAELVARLEQRLVLLDAVSAARAVLHDAVVANTVDRQDAAVLLRSLRAVVLGMFGGSTETLNDFGFTVRTPRKPDAETRAKAVEKLRATRLARHTMGKRQKEHVPADPPPVTNGANTGSANGAPPPAPA